MKDSTVKRAAVGRLAVVLGQVRHAQASTLAWQVGRSSGASRNGNSSSRSATAGVRARCVASPLKGIAVMSVLPVIRACHLRNDSTS